MAARGKLKNDFRFRLLLSNIGAPAAEDHQAEPHTYRIWYGHLHQPQMARRRLRTYDSRRRSRTRWRPYLSTCIAYIFTIWLIFFTILLILCSIDSCQIKVSAHQTAWPYCGLRLKFMEVKCFWKLTPDQVVDFHWFAGSSILYKLLERAKKPELRFWAWLNLYIICYISYYYLLMAMTLKWV